MVIQTDRNIYPNFKTYIQLGEYLIRRNITYGFIKDIRFDIETDASPFEIFKIYNGHYIRDAEILLRIIFDLANNTTDKIILEKFMRKRGYRPSYLGYIKIDNRAVEEAYPLFSR